MKSIWLSFALLSLLFPNVFGCGCKSPNSNRADITEALQTALIPGFAICNTDKGDGGITLDELHSDICQDFIASVSDSDTADSDFEYFDSNADGVVSLKEFLDLADTLINM